MIAVTPDYFSAFFKGFVTMASLVIAIGVQNTFVLKQGLQRNGLLVATLCFLCDIALVSLGALGLGHLFATNTTLQLLASFGGAAFLGIYGLRSLNAAKNAKGLQLEPIHKASVKNVALTALAVSLLNPHAILDTVVLVGAQASLYAGMGRFACALGAMSASGVWFYGLAFGARKLAPILTQPKIWRSIDLLIGVMMLILAFGLAKSGVQRLHTPL